MARRWGQPGHIRNDKLQSDCVFRHAHEKIVALFHTEVEPMVG
jgi:hypothetical protein